MQQEILIYHLINWLIPYCDRPDCSFCSIYFSLTIQTWQTHTKHCATTEREQVKAQSHQLLSNNGAESWMKGEPSWFLLGFWSGGGLTGEDSVCVWLQYVKPEHKRCICMCKKVSWLDELRPLRPFSDLFKCILKLLRHGVLLCDICCFSFSLAVCLVVQGGVRGGVVTVVWHGFCPQCLSYYFHTLIPFG